jgi:hypothetical protein
MHCICEIHLTKTFNRQFNSTMENNVERKRACSLSYTGAWVLFTLVTNKREQSIFLKVKKYRYERKGREKWSNTLKGALFFLIAESITSL